MAKHETLSSLFTDIADKLREKTDFDTFSWVTDTAPFEVASICYGAGKFVAVGGSSVAYSEDGINWMETSLSEDLNLFAVCYGSGKFVAVGSDSAAYSTDGVNWTEAVIPTYSTMQSVCYGNDRFVAVGNGGKTLYSLDGITWIGENGIYLGANLRSVCYGDGKFVAVGNGIITGSSSSGGWSKAVSITQYSTDGISWTKNEVESTIAWKSVCYGNGIFAAATSEGVFTSYAAVDWMGWNTGAAKSICYGDGKFVAVTDAGHIVYSEDGSTWAKDSRVLDDSTLGGISAIVFGADRFAVVGDRLVGYGKAGLIADNFPDTIAELSPLNIDYGAAPPSNTSKLWIPLAAKPANVEVSFNTSTPAVEAIVTKDDAPLPYALAYAAAAEVDGLIYIIGGNGTNNYTKIRVYDPTENTIADVVDDAGEAVVLPNNTYGAAAVAIDGKIYIFGGASYKNWIQIFDPVTKTVDYNEDRKLNTAVGYASAVAINGKAYIFGGQIGASTYSKVIQIYDPETEVCTTSENAALAVVTYGTAAVEIGGKAYIFGGYSYKDTIQEYDPNTDSIVTKAAVLPDGIFLMSAAAINGRAYIFGGQYGTSGYYDSIWEYDPVTDAVTPMGQVLSAVAARTAAAVANGKAYIFGGHSGTNTTIHEYTVQYALDENFVQVDAKMDVSADVSTTPRVLTSIVNWPKQQLKAWIGRVLLGDADGYAAEQEAYIYDTAAAAWKSLSGSVYTG